MKDQWKGEDLWKSCKGGWWRWWYVVIMILRKGVIQGSLHWRKHVAPTRKKKTTRLTWDSDTKTVSGMQIFQNHRSPPIACHGKIIPPIFFSANPRKLPEDVGLYSLGGSSPPPFQWQPWRFGLDLIDPSCGKHLLTSAKGVLQISRKNHGILGRFFWMIRLMVKKSGVKTSWGW